MDPEVTVLSGTTYVEVYEPLATEIVVTEPFTTEIVVFSDGPRGPLGPVGPVGGIGPVGPPGSRTLAFEMAFATAAVSWIIPHNLNTRNLAVAVFELDGATEMDAEITIVDENTVRVDHYYPESGLVRLLY